MYFYSCETRRLNNQILLYIDIPVNWMISFDRQRTQARDLVPSVSSFSLPKEVLGVKSTNLKRKHFLSLLGARRSVPFPAAGYGGALSFADSLEPAQSCDSGRGVSVSLCICFTE